MSPGYGGRRDPVEDRDVEMDYEQEITAVDAAGDQIDIVAQDQNPDAEIARRRAEVEETRCSVTNTLDEIKDRLDPHVIAEQARGAASDIADKAKQTAHEVTENAVHRVQEATIGRAQDAVSGAASTVRHAGSSAGHFIQDNAIPLALIGVGLGWLWQSQRRTDHDSGRYQGREYYGGDAGSSQGHSSYSGQTTGHYIGYQGGSDIQGNSGYWGSTGTASGYPGGTSQIGGMQEQSEGMTGRVQDKAGHIKEQVQEKAGQVKHQVQEKASQVKHQVQEKSSQVTHMARERKERAVDTFQRTLQENPMALGIGALALGAVVGLLIPETRREREMMGETRDRVMDTVQQKAQDIGHKVQSVASEAVQSAKETAKEEARNQGLAA